MQSVHIVKSSKKGSPKKNNVKASEQEKEKGICYQNQEESIQQPKFLKKKRGRPPIKNKGKVKKTFTKNEQAKIQKEHIALIDSEGNKLTDIPIYIDLSNFDSENESDAEKESVVNDEEKTKNSNETFVSDSPLTEFTQESNKSKSSKLKRRNALITKEFFTETIKTLNNLPETEKDLLGIDEKSNRRTKSLKALPVNFELNTARNIADFKPIKNNPKSSELNLQTNQLNREKQQDSNKDKSRQLVIKNAKEEIESSSIGSLSQAESFNYSRSSEKTAYFFNENLPEIKKKKAPNEIIFSAPGSLVYDIPFRVNKFSIDSNLNIHSVIEWKSRYDGSIPSNSALPLEVIQQKHPDLVCEYLVKRLKSRLANKK